MTQYDDAIEPGTRRRPTVAELFAGVGGFHLALDRAGFDVVWSNQWEPSTKAQHAFECYEQHVRQGDFQRYGREVDGHGGDESTTLGLTEHRAVNDDIAVVLDSFEAQTAGPKRPMFPVIPDVDVLVGGFPCQDYSVAKTLRQAHGLVGRKGVLWWEIHRLLRLKLASGRPVRYLFLENVDRLLKSPSGQRGRDFAVMLASLADLGYEVEWRVINPANYGFPQKRRRVFIIGRLGRSSGDPKDQMESSGVLARAFPMQPRAAFDWAPITLDRDAKVVSDTFGVGAAVSAFGNAGVMRISGTKHAPVVWTADVDPVYSGPYENLGDILEDAADVPEQFFVGADELPKWEFLKGRKSLSRISKATGLEYTYDEGAIPFPDPTDTPSRTILTGEGGATPSRFKHIIQTGDGRFRRLTPRELERLNGFPGDWTAGMSDGRRAFMMGNALVVGAIEKVADELAVEISANEPRVISKGRRGELGSAMPGRQLPNPPPTSAAVRNVMRANRARDTAPELALRQALRAAHLSGYRVNWRKAPGRPDIAYPGRRIAIFVHGCYWHHCPRCYPNLPKSNPEFWARKFELNHERDERKRADLEALDWAVIEAWECDVRRNVSGAVDEIRRLLS